MADWTEKYRPQTLGEIRGNDKAVKALREWAEAWSDHKEAAILYGKPGIGKTSAAHALADDMDWGVVELNASDDRTADNLNRIAGRAAMNQSLEGTMQLAREAPPGDRDNDETAGAGGRQLIIVDEADNIHYQKDYGGQQAIKEVIESATQPIVLLANDLYDMSSGLRNAGRQIQFKAVNSSEIESVLRYICRREGIKYTDSDIERLAIRNEGDLRGAINDLQAESSETELVIRDDEGAASRDREKSIWTFLDAVLKEADPEEALYTAFDVDETPDSLIKWVEDKAPMVYTGEELRRAYQFLAEADKWLGRVRATQNYSYWRYVNDNMAAGVAAAREHDRGGFTRYGGPPFRSTSNARRDHVARAIAESSGVSMATARRWVLPFLAAMTHHCQNRELTVEMTAAFDLEAEHVAFVTGSGKDTNKVQSIVADARERREAATVEHSGGAFEGEAEDAPGLAAFAGDGERESDGDAPAGDAEAEEGRAADPDEAAEDDSQSGLSDFM